jgi:hypothetical protein
MRETLYAELAALGVPMDSHESDLYVPVTPETVAAVKAHGWAGVTTFTAQGGGELAGRLCFDLPFANVPWWEART